MTHPALIERRLRQLADELAPRGMIVSIPRERDATYLRYAADVLAQQASPTRHVIRPGAKWMCLCGVGFDEFADARAHFEAERDALRGASVAPTRESEREPMIVDALTFNAKVGRGASVAPPPNKQEPK